MVNLNENSIDLFIVTANGSADFGRVYLDFKTFKRVNSHSSLLGISSELTRRILAFSPILISALAHGSYWDSSFGALLRLCLSLAISDGAATG